MKDQRLRVFRAGLDGLVESLEALVRVARWTDSELPEPLHTAVQKLPERLAVADRLTASTFVGSTRDQQEVSSICERLRKLEVAYVAYKKRVDGRPAQQSQALTELESELMQTSDSPS